MRYTYSIKRVGLANTIREIQDDLIMIRIRSNRYNGLTKKQLNLLEDRITMGDDHMKTFSTHSNDELEICIERMQSALVYLVPNEE